MWVADLSGVRSAGAFVRRRNTCATCGLQLKVRCGARVSEVVDRVGRAALACGVEVRHHNIIVNKHITGHAYVT
jgi:hypothetical protein